MTPPETTLERSLTARSQVALDARSDRGGGELSPPDPQLLDTIERYLLDGETHYPVRPGMTELREAVDERLSVLGAMTRGPGSVLICASAGEALFVTILGLGHFGGGTLWGTIGDVHEPLLQWTGVTVVKEDPGGDEPYVRDLGSRLFSDERIGVRPDELIIGDLGGLEMAPFNLGFVAGPPALVATITKWKQASSICAPSPPQRAALTALGVGS